MIPRTLLSRLFTFFWVGFAMVSASIITATVTETITGFDHMHISGQKVILSVVTYTKLHSHVQYLYTLEIIPSLDYRHP